MDREFKPFMLQIFWTKLGPFPFEKNCGEKENTFLPGILRFINVFIKNLKLYNFRRVASFVLGD